MDIVAVLTRVMRDKTEAIERQQAALSNIEAQLAEKTALIREQQADLHRLEARFAALEARLAPARP